MSLTNTTVRNAKAGKKAVKLFDERGLYLEVSPAGGKWWRLKYRFGGKEKRLSSTHRRQETRTLTRQSQTFCDIGPQSGIRSVPGAEMRRGTCTN